jgi:tetratricopeptide (TPR) repeat protein
MKKQLHILLLFFGLFFSSQLLCAQVDFNKTPDDDLGNVEDTFQEYFFEALKQSGIENYDKAVIALQKCIELDPAKSVVYFELGKNYNRLKNFGAAEDALKIAVEKTPDNEWYLDQLYDVYHQQNDLNKAIKTLKQLVKFHPDYKEDLATAYFENKDYKNTIKILDELDHAYGVSITRDYLRNRIYDVTGRDKDRIENLEERLVSNPEDENNYLTLIYRYSEKGESKKAFDMAKQLLKVKPESELVHLALYKYYLVNDDVKNAITSMKIALKSAKVNSESKAKVLNDFVSFVRKNQQYETDLLEVTSMISNEEDGKSYVEIAQYYLRKDDKAEALRYYKMALENERDNFGILRNILLLHIDLKNYDEVIKISQESLENYPSQSVLYLVYGVALNRQNKADEAIEILDTGIDYVIEDTQMEADFYKQMSIAYRLKGNITQSETFSKKAQNLLNKQQ